MRILHLLDRCVPSEGAWHILNMWPQSEQAGDVLAVCCLGRDSEDVGVFRQAGVSVHALGWSRWFDPRALWNLRRHLDAINPDVIHVWDRFTLRVLAIVNRQRLRQVVLTLDGDAKHRWWDRRLIDAVRTWSPWELTNVPSVSHSDSMAAQNEIPTGNPVSRPFRIVCAGWNDRNAGFRSAIWAFDFLRHYYLGLQLDLVGVEDASGSLFRLAVGLEVTDRVTFHPPRHHLRDTFARADLVWLPGVTGGEIAWEAMHLGKPIVASDVPSFRRVLGEDSVSRLVSVGDVTALSRATHELLRSTELRDRLGRAGQVRAGLIEPCWRKAYEQIASR